MRRQFWFFLRVEFYLSVFDVTIMRWELKVCPTKILVTYIALNNNMVTCILYMCLELINRFEDPSASIAGLTLRAVLLNMIM